MKLIRTQDMHESRLESLLRKNFISPEINKFKASILRLIWRSRSDHELKLIAENIRLLDYGIADSSAEALAEDYMFRRIKFSSYESWHNRMSMSDFDCVVDAEHEGDLKGSVVCLLHMIDPYILAGAITKFIADTTASEILLLRTPLSPSEERVFSRIRAWAGADRRSGFIDTRSTSEVRQAIREVRKGSVLLSYADMPAEFGGAAEVRFLGRSAWFAHGFIDISEISGSRVFVAWLSRANKNRHTLNIKQLFGRNKAEKSAELAKILEQVVRSSPSDWDFIYSLRSYFYPPIK